MTTTSDAQPPQLASAASIPPPTNITKKRWKWRYRKPQDLTPAQEHVFLNMQIRKNRRSLSGTKSRNKTFELLAVAIVIIAAFALGSWQREDDLDNEAFVSLTFGNCVFIAVWIFVAFIITTVFGESAFGELTTWMFIYLPLITIVVAFMFDTEATIREQFNLMTYDRAVWLLLVAAELLTIAIFFTIYYLVPTVMTSEWFRSHSRAAKSFRVNVVGDFTMTYRGGPLKFFKKRKACKYEGEKNEKGEPHGLGRWFDDGFDGEVLVGTWQNGHPIAPFISRHYGRGDVFAAVRIAIIQATDDEFQETRFWPSNEKPIRCAIASVECSVSGSFYNNLPRSEILFGPNPFNVESSMEDLCNKLIHMGSDEEPNVLQISANDPRGVSVTGHVHSKTGKAFVDVGDLTVTVMRAQSGRTKTIHRPSFMPKTEGRQSIFQLDRLLVRESSDESGDDKSEGEDVEESSLDSLPELYLSVNDWVPVKHKEVLIFFAGFNCSQEFACRSFGQFLAMTKLDTRVHPIIYAWPCGTALSYHPASRISSGERNHQNLLQLLKGLQNAGIRTINLMSHSMGAQTLIGSFCDKDDGSRSEVSRCFQITPSFLERSQRTSGSKHQGTPAIPEGEDIEIGMKDDGDDDNLLICKTFTMLNPDFPVVPFVTHAFQSIRRICRTVTVVGDRTDGALFFSQSINGPAVYLGYEQREPLLPNDANKQHLRYLYTIGRNIDDLYLPKDQQQTIKSVHSGDSRQSGSRHRHNPLVFREKAPMSLVSDEDAEPDKAWLDLDVIDTTGLDTNIANIRHTAFSLNPNLLNDLEELITTGNRAMKRSSLLYRDGNQFSFCHVPSYVSF